MQRADRAWIKRTADTGEEIWTSSFKIKAKLEIKEHLSVHLTSQTSSLLRSLRFACLWKVHFISFSQKSVISKVGKFRTRLSWSEILSDLIRCKLFRYPWFCSARPRSFTCVDRRQFCRCTIGASGVLRGPYFMCKTKMAACALRIKCCVLESCCSFDGSFPSRSTWCQK